MSTADFVRHRDASLNADTRISRIRDVVGAANLSAISANQLAEKLLGNTIYANVLLLGYAWQKGLVPVSLPALLRAIELNGVQVEANQQAFGYGRIAAVDTAFVTQELALKPDSKPLAESLDRVIERRYAFLVDYQDARLADRYRALVERVRKVETNLGNSEFALSEAVARAYFKCLAYKDEYEVARLHTEQGFLEELRRQHGKQAKFRFHLAPPLLNNKLDARGRPLKKEFGGWIIPLFRLLARLRRLRGTPFDLFGKTAERRMERALIGEFEATLDTLLQNLDSGNHADATAIVLLYMDIRGYGPVKEEAVASVRKRLEDALTAYTANQQQAA